MTERERAAPFVVDTYCAHYCQLLQPLPDPLNNIDVVTAAGGHSS
jgi:hypothetical protein